jgi:DNA-binding NtrC family response regulator
MDQSTIDRNCVIEGLVARSTPMIKALALLPVLAGSDATVLITGETGTGKELVSRAIHRLSPRAERPFIPINCGAVPESLVEAELFGYEKGAFTGADGRRAGLLREAEGGTLYLDEIDSLTPRTQATLLRVLQDKNFRPLGGKGEQRANVRFVVSTNASLRSLVEVGRFRADLYYRLCVLCLNLPPLRDRHEDILPLGRFFLRKYFGDRARVPTFTEDAEQALLGYDWPGNVRELENLVLRAGHLSETSYIEADHLGIRPSTASDRVTDISRSFTELKRIAIQDFERNYLSEIMSRHDGNISQAARTAGKDRRDIRRLLRKYGINRGQFLK